MSSTPKTSFAGPDRASSQEMGKDVNTSPQRSFFSSFSLSFLRDVLPGFSGGRSSVGTRDLEAGHTHVPSFSHDFEDPGNRKQFWDALGNFRGISISSIDSKREPSQPEIRAFVKCLEGLTPGTETFQKKHEELQEYYKLFQFEGKLNHFVDEDGKIYRDNINKLKNPNERKRNVIAGVASGIAGIGPAVGLGIFSKNMLELNERSEKMSKRSDPDIDALNRAVVDPDPISTNDKTHGPALSVRAAPNNCTIEGTKKDIETLEADTLSGSTWLPTWGNPPTKDAVKVTMQKVSEAKEVCPRPDPPTKVFPSCKLEKVMDNVIGCSEFFLANNMTAVEGGGIGGGSGGIGNGKIDTTYKDRTAEGALVGVGTFAALVLTGVAIDKFLIRKCQGGGINAEVERLAGLLGNASDALAADRNLKKNVSQEQQVGRSSIRSERGSTESKRRPSLG